jgi:SAM-dependent methyltransferase
MTDARAFLHSLATDVTPREIDRDIFDVTATPPRAHYDLTAPAYDVLVGSATWHRLLWKTSPNAFRAFAERVYHSRADGAHAEVGCGSLLFTAQLYGGDRGRAVVLIDQSLQMLRIARRRLTKHFGRVPEHVVLVRADGRDLRLRGGWASTLIAMHVLHVVREREALLRTVRALMRAQGSTVGLTSIFLAGGRGDVFVRVFAALGELSPGLTRSELDALLAAQLGGDIHVDVEGSMAFVTRVQG